MTTPTTPTTPKPRVTNDLRKRVMWSTAVTLWSLYLRARYVGCDPLIASRYAIRGVVSRMWHTNDPNPLPDVSMEDGRSSWHKPTGAKINKRHTVKVHADPERLLALIASALPHWERKVPKDKRLDPTAWTTSILDNTDAYKAYVAPKDVWNKWYVARDNYHYITGYRVPVWEHHPVWHANRDHVGKATYSWDSPLYTHRLMIWEDYPAPIHLMPADLPYGAASLNEAVNMLTTYYKHHHIVGTEKIDAFVPSYLLADNYTGTASKHPGKLLGRGIAIMQPTDIVAAACGHPGIGWLGGVMLHGKTHKGCENGNTALRQHLLKWWAGYNRQEPGIPCILEHPVWTTLVAYYIPDTMFADNINMHPLDLMVRYLEQEVTKYAQEMADADQEWADNWAGHMLDIAKDKLAKAKEYRSALLD